MSQDENQHFEMTTVGILLAAGKSSRFGPDNKLLETFNGKPLCMYAAKAMSDAGVRKRVAIVSDASVASLLPEFEVVHCSGSQSDSLKAGTRAAIAMGADQIVVCLADMPFVTSLLIAKLLSLAKIHSTCASKWDERISPPAVIPKERFGDLLELEGDRGAFSMFRGQPDLTFLHVEENELTDLDTIADFRTFRSAH